AASLRRWAERGGGAPGGGGAMSNPRLVRGGVLDDPVQDLVEVDPRLVAGEGAQLLQVGHAPRHVLEALLVGLVVGDVHDLAAAAGALLRPARAGARGCP